MPTYPIQLATYPTMRRAISFVNDNDGIKTSIATAVTAQEYDGADLNGALVDATQTPDIVTLAKLEGVARTFRVVTGSNAGAYVVGSEITATGTFDGAVVTDTVTIGDADGGETLDGTQRFDTFDTIDVEAQADTDGTFTFGVGFVKPKYVIRKIRAGVAGNVISTGEDGIAVTTALLDSNVIDCADVSINPSTTALPVTIFM